MLAKRKRILLALVFLLAMVVVATTVLLAQTSPSFDLSWHVVGSGGGISSSASYSVNGTAGQSAASPALSGNNSFTVSSGYWYSGSSLYLPLMQKN